MATKLYFILAFLVFFFKDRAWGITTDGGGSTGLGGTEENCMMEHRGWGWRDIKKKVSVV